MKYIIAHATQQFSAPLIKRLTGTLPPYHPCLKLPVIRHASKECTNANMTSHRDVIKEGDDR